MGSDTDRDDLMSRQAPIRRHRFTTEAYFRMAEVGILADDVRFELLDGQIVEVSPPGTRHAAVVSRLTALFVPAAARRVIVRVQDPVLLDNFSAPQPDLAVVRYVEDFHERAHPSAEDVLLAVEVADSSLRIDLVRKARLYAVAGVREYWVVDLGHERILVHTAPGRQGYANVRSIARGEVVSAAALPGQQWVVDEILGRPAAS
jgi:Uma2 family endonuclease